MDRERPVVYVIDDDPSVRKGLSRLIETAGFHVETFASASEFLKSVRRNGPACLVLDVRLPDLNGMALQEQLAKGEDALPIIFITGYGDIPMSVSAMKRGAVDFLPKPFNAKQLLGAVRQALHKDAQRREKDSKRNEVLKKIDALTPREHEVLRWLVTGMLNKQIAYELGITEKTVKVHRGRVMQKMGASSIAELVRLAQLADISPLP